MDAAVMLVGGMVQAIERGEQKQGLLAPIAIRIVQAALTP